jgi:hypothetical protein
MRRTMMSDLSTYPESIELDDAGGGYASISLCFDDHSLTVRLTPDQLRAFALDAMGLADEMIWDASLDSTL